MIKNVLSTENFYYSIGMDISHTFQWLSENANPELHLLPLLQRIDKKFVWNAKLSENFNSFEVYFLFRQSPQNFVRKSKKKYFSL
jgi:hypothetical protein